MPRTESVIIPAAGFGTRLRPISAVIPKEMLPVGRAPVLEHVLQECRAAGLRRLLFVISPGKEMVRSYFGDGSRWDVHCDYAVQPEMRGLGDAILQGAEWTGGEPFAVAFGDCMVVGGPPGGPLALERAVAVHAERGAAAVVVTETVPRERSRRYGILRPAAPVADPVRQPFAVAGLVEKPRPEDAPSRQAVAARWVLGPAVLDAIRAQEPGPNGEVGLTEAVSLLLAQGLPVWAVPLLPGERRLDIGSWDTYLCAAAEAALADPEAGPGVRRTLERSATEAVA